MDFHNQVQHFLLGSGATLGDGFLLGMQIPLTGVFEERSRATDRRPTNSIFVERQGDITDDGIVADFIRRAEDSLEEPNYGVGTITISDDEEKYIDNGRSVFRTNDKVMIFAGFEGENLPRFSGIIRDIQVQADLKVQVLTIAEQGYSLRTSKTSGDFSSFGTPKLLVDELIGRIRAGDIVYEDETGPPTTFEFGNTDLSLRSFWAMIHGASLVISYLQHFDERGRLNLTRRTTFDNTGYVFTDFEIEKLTHIKVAKLINHKTIDFVQIIRPEFDAGDGVRAGQHARGRTDSASKHRYGEHENQETDELIGSWNNAGLMIDQTLDFFPFPRDIYRMKIPALPQFQISDQIFIDSAETGIKGFFSIIGIEERISSTSYSGIYTLLSEGERF